MCSMLTGTNRVGQSISLFPVSDCSDGNLVVINLDFQIVYYFMLSNGKDLTAHFFRQVSKVKNLYRKSLKKKKKKKKPGDGSEHLIKATWGPGSCV